MQLGFGVLNRLHRVFQNGVTGQRSRPYRHFLQRDYGGHTIVATNTYKQTSNIRTIYANLRPNAIDNYRVLRPGLIYNHRRNNGRQHTTFTRGIYILPNRYFNIRRSTLSTGNLYYLFNTFHVNNLFYYRPRNDTHRNGTLLLWGTRDCNTFSTTIRLRRGLVLALMNIRPATKRGYITRIPYLPPYTLL